MQHRTTVKLTAIAAVLLCSLAGGAAFGQSSGQYAQTVNKAPTVTEVFMPRGMLPEQPITLKALVHTGISTSGIVAPTPNITFYVDGTGSGNVIGTPTLTSATATNLLNYSEAFSKWNLGGSAAPPTVTDQSALGPFGTTNSPNGGNTASVVVFPDTTSGTVSRVSSQVTGTSYAGQQVVFSVWAQSATASTLQLVIADGSGGNSTVATMHVGTDWRRFHVQVTLPGGAASGLTATTQSTGQATQTVNLFGAQVESGVPTQGVYVQTTGTGNITGTGAIATLSYAYTVGAHTTSVSYGGDTNFLGSVSNTLNTAAAQASATLALASSSNPSVYGTSTSFTATLTGDGSPFASPGAITISFGSTVIASCPVTNGATTVQTCVAITNALPGGTDPITATYSADPNYNAATSNTVAQVVNQAGATVTMTSTPEPSIYGQTVAFTINVAGVSGLAVPTGTVMVIDNGSCTSACTGGGALGGGALTLTNGTATFSNATLTGGQHNIVITFTTTDQNYK